MSLVPVLLEERHNLGHLLKECNDNNAEEEGEDSNMCFGPWMRASPTRPIQNGGGGVKQIKESSKNGF